MTKPNVIQTGDKRVTGLHCPQFGEVLSTSKISCLKAAKKMLLNASHEITNSGLPQNVQERYVRYKQGNRAIVAWMTSYGPDKYKGRKTLPIKRMVALGKLLCDKVLDIGSLPPDVDYYFRDVIRERTYLTRHFRDHRDHCERDDIETVNHEHFTESLKRIHQILLTAGKPKQRTPTETGESFAASNPSAKHRATAQQARFSLLLNEADHQLDGSDEDSYSDADTNATSECSHSSPELPSCCSETDDWCVDFLEANGPIAKGIETVMFLQRIERVSIAIRACWTKLGSSNTSFAASSAYTNILIQRAIHHSRDFVDSEPSMVAFHSIKQVIEGWYSTTGSDCQQSLLDVAEALAATERSLGASESSDNSRPDGIGTSRFDSLIHDLISNLSSVSRPCDKSDLTYGWLSSMGLLDHASANTRNRFQNCIILYLVSLSHCAYSETLTKPASIALPRISALQLANEALSTTRQFINDKSIFPCQCTNTLSFRIVQMQKELEKFAKFKCWTPLMQSPLVAGNQALEILDLCSYYGMHLFHYRHYVGSVLHSYNALVEVGTIARIPILDEVCELFAPVLFTTSKQPQTGFMASWLRYIGARLRFRTGKNSKHQNHKDTWCMSVPAHTAARSAGLNISDKSNAAHILPKFDYGTIDSTMKLKHNGWIMTIEQDQQLDQILEITNGNSNSFDQVTSTSPNQPKSGPTSPKHGSKVARHNRTKSCTIDTLLAPSNQEKIDTSACSNIHHSILSTFTHDSRSSDADCKTTIPPSRFNLLTLFHSMTKVIAGISDATHSEQQSLSSSLSSSAATTTSKTGKGQMCLCFAQTILQGADRILDTRKRNGLDAKGATWSKNEKECIGCFKDELLKVLRSDCVLVSEEDHGAAASSSVYGGGGTWVWESLV